MNDAPLVVLALAGPLLAGAAWAILLPWPSARRAVGGGVALAGNAAAWAVFWAAYRGDPASWRSFEPGVLDATVVAMAEVGILLAAVRVERMTPRVMPAVVAGLAVSASAVAAGAYAESLAVLAVAIPLPTLAVGAVAVANRRADLRGLAGLAAADVVAVAALSLLHARSGSVVFQPAAPLIVGLLLAAAAAKAGAVPGLATWRLTDEPGVLFAPALRGQGVALAALGGLVLARGDPEPLVAVVSALAVLGAAAAALRAANPSRALAAATGAGCAMPFVALGLGGGAGVRAFLLLVPPLLLGAAAAALLSAHDPPGPGPVKLEQATGPSAQPRPLSHWVGVAALGVILGSILGLPPGGGFPGTWLTLALATVRGEAIPADLLIAGAVAVGLTVSFLGVVALIPAARPGRAAVVVGAAVAATLVYAGTQPVRLGLGWWLRVEAELGTPRLLPSVGAPDLPAIGGVNLVLALAPAVILVAAVVVLARGFREAHRPFVPAVVKPIALPAPVGPVVERMRRAGVGVVVTAVLGVASLALAARLVIMAGQGGFL